MRLRRLDLKAYGKFTDRTLDFGEARAGQPDLHVIYGPNEAGKSTTLNAFLDLLFGIETRSSYAFHHPYAAMRIGGALELRNGAALEAVRIKRPQNSLLDPQGGPIEEGLIRAELGGVDREAYCAMFSLDDATLERGGESILASKGDLGQLLFSASAGLADLGRRLGELRDRAGSFYRYKARSGELGALKERLAALKEERERIDTLASRHAQLTELRRQAEAAYDAVIRERAGSQSRLTQIDRLLNGLPRHARLKGLLADIAMLAALPEVPADLAAALPRLRDDDVKLAAEAEAGADELRRLEALLAEAVTDDAALALIPRVEALSGQKARHQTAEADLPKLAREVAACDAAIAEALRHLGRPGEAQPESLLIAGRETASLRALMDSRSGIDNEARGAAEEVERAARQVEEAQARLRELGADGADEASATDEASAGLAALVDLVAGEDPTPRLRHAEQARLRQAALLDSRMKALAPWADDAAALAALPAPEAGTVARWAAEVAEAQARTRQRAEAAGALAAEVQRLAAEREALIMVDGATEESEAAAIRRLRDTAWAAHRSALDAATANAFEATLARDDEITGARLRKAESHARLRQIAHALAVKQTEARLAREAADAAAAQLAALDAGIADAIAAVIPGAALPLWRFEGWLKARTEALEAARTLATIEQDLSVAEADARALQERLMKALLRNGVSAEPGADLAGLLVLARASVRRSAELRQQREAFRDRLRQLDERKARAARAAAARQEWTMAWAEACGATWLGRESRPGAGPSTPTVAEVAAVLDELPVLATRLREREGYLERIAKMERDQAEFAASVAALSDALGEVMAGDPLATFGAIEARVRHALAMAARREEAAKRVEQARSRLRELEERRRLHEARRAHVLGLLGVGALTDAAARLREIERREQLRHEAEETRRELLSLLRCASVEEAEALLDAADQTALETEKSETQARLDDEDRRVQQAFADKTAARDQLDAIGGDDSVARIEARRRVVLLEIEEGAERYLRLRLGAAAAEQALAAYREAHRSAMMRRAAEAFRMLTRDAYRDLRTQPGKDGDILVAVSGDGGSKLAAEMSKGTRFQLYLALRAAGYDEFVRARAPVPFIADDILETFDDLRAEEAFRLFCAMGGSGQVIYLTHHRHLCRIAQEVCPTVRLHELG